MPITLNCPKCHKPFRVRDESIGGRVRCPSCGSVLQVPAALAPASSFDEPPKGEATGSEATQRPMAEEVSVGSHYGSPHGVAIPGSPRLEPAGPSPAVSLPGPPSIKIQAAKAPPPQMQRSAPPVSLPTAPTPRRPTILAGPAPATDAAWAKVRSGLGMIRWAMFLFVLLILAGFGQCLWVVFDHDRAMDPRQSLLGREGWPLWKELLLAYSMGLLTPAALLLLIGRLRCGGAPPEANARGLARAAAFFTLIGVASAVVFLGMTYFNFGEKLKLPSEARLVALYAGIPAALLADVFTLLFIGQIGWPLRRPTLQLSVAGFFAYAALLPAGVLIGMQFYPVIGLIRESMEQTGSPLGAPESDLAQRATIWGVILLTATIMFFLRYAGVAGAARRAIRKLLAGGA